MRRHVDLKSNRWESIKGLAMKLYSVVTMGIASVVFKFQVVSLNVNFL